jgi:opacity protein-like surface antigen
MKKIMMTLVMAVAAIAASAQNNTLREPGTISIQPKVGIGIGYLSGSWTSDVIGNDNKAKVGFVGGVEGEYYINNWLGVAAGVNFAQQGWKTTKPSRTGDYDVKTKLNYLNIPITADFYVLPGFALKTGVQFGFLASAKINDTDWKDDAKKFNFSIPVGLSYEYKNVVLDMRYNISVTKVNKNSDADNKYRSDLLQITLGYKFDLK